MDLPAYISAAGLLLAGVGAIAQVRRQRKQSNHPDHDELVQFLEARLADCEEREKQRDRESAPRRKGRPRSE